MELLWRRRLSATLLCTSRTRSCRRCGFRHVNRAAVFGSGYVVPWVWPLLLPTFVRGGRAWFWDFALRTFWPVSICAVNLRSGGGLSSLVSPIFLCPFWRMLRLLPTLALSPLSPFCRLNTTLASSCTRFPPSSTHSSHPMDEPMPTGSLWVILLWSIFSLFGPVSSSYCCWRCLPSELLSIPLSASLFPSDCPRLSPRLTVSPACAPVSSSPSQCILASYLRLRQRLCTLREFAGLGRALPRTALYCLRHPVFLRTLRTLLAPPFERPSFPPSLFRCSFCL